MARQLTFDLPHEVALGPDDFFVSPANAAAFGMIGDWPNWPEGKLALVGPRGSGKTHLARVWQHLTGGRAIPATAIDPAADLPPDGARLAVEDMEQLAPAAEEYLFHLHNHLRATGGRLLMTSDRAPADWPLRLPDLASRMQAASVARLGDPDDALLSAVLAKHFADRQIAPPPDLVPYLARRIERSFAAAAAVVTALDRAAMERRQPVTRALARAILEAGS